MASYEQAPTYNAQSYAFRPYSLPYQEIVKTIQAKQQYWIEGADKVRSAAQQAAGLNLSLQGNREALSSFMKDANEQVSKAAKSDLSDSDNIKGALNIFTPLYSGDTQMSQNIMGDHAITTRARDIQNQYEQLKNKNGGKGYSSVNQQYSLDSYNDFLRGNDPRSWKEHLQNLKDSIPYYDYKPEIDKAIANCKTTNSSDSVNGMYVQTSQTTSIDKNCLSGSLSSNAEKQIQIEGYVKYGKNYQALGDQYANSLLSDRQNFATQKGRLAAALIDPKTTPEQKQTIQESLDHYNDQLGNIDRSLSKLHSGDYSDIQNNYESVAGSIFKNQKMNAITSAFSTKNSIKSDPVQMMYAKFIHDQNMLTQKERFDAALQDKINLGKKKVGTDPTDPTSFIPTASTEDVTKKGINEHEADLKSVNDKLEANDKFMYDSIKSDPRFQAAISGGHQGPELQALVDNLAKDYSSLNPNSPISKGLKNREDLMQQRGRMILENQIIESSPIAKEARNKIATSINDIRQGEIISQYGSNLHLNPDQIKELLTTNKSGNIELKTIEVPTSYVNMAYGSPGLNKFEHKQVLQVNGHTFRLEGTQLGSYLKKNFQQLNDYHNTLDGLYKENFVAQHPYYDLKPSNDDKDPTDTQKQIAGVLSGADPSGKVDAKDVTLVGSRYYNGEVIVNLPPKKTGSNKFEAYSEKELNQAFGTNGYTIRKVGDSPNTYVVGNVQGFNRNNEINEIQNIQDFAEKITQLKKQSGQIAPKTLMPSYRGIQIAAITDPNGGIYFELRNKDGKVNYVNSASQLTSTLQSITNQ